MSGLLNFNSMPKDGSKRNVSIGSNHMVITDAEVTRTQANKQAIVFTLNVKGTDRPNIKEWCTVFDKDGNVENFGQFKLGRILEAINVIPEGDFTLDVLPTLVKGKEFIAVLKYQDEDEKYLEVAHPDVEGNYLPVQTQTSPGVQVQQETPAPSPEVAGALDNDNIL